MQAAIAALRLAYEQPDTRKRLAQAARDNIVHRQETAWSAPYLAELENCLNVKVCLERRKQLRRRIAINEIFDPTLRSLNMKTLFSKKIA